MKIYTRTGDDGTTSLHGGIRINKYHERMEAIGSLDELISWIGLLRVQKENNEHADFLLSLQDQLMKCAAYLALGTEQKSKENMLPHSDSVRSIENEIDKMDETLKPLRNLILPGGNTLVSYCHIARCVCRRAERTVLRLNAKEKIPSVIYIFLNRIADYLFILSRKISLVTDNEEIKWIK